MGEQNYKMVATTMSGLEEILAEELNTLGAQNIHILNRAVEFVGDLGFMYKANLNLRTAIRILKPIFEFKARNEKELYRKIYDYNWEQYLVWMKLLQFNLLVFLIFFLIVNTQL